MKEFFKKAAMSITGRRIFNGVVAPFLLMTPSACAVHYVTDPSIPLRDKTNPIMTVLDQAHHDIFVRTIDDPCNYWTRALTGDRYCRERDRGYYDQSWVRKDYKYDWYEGQFKLDSIRVDSHKYGYIPYHVAPPTQTTIYDYNWRQRRDILRENRSIHDGRRHRVGPSDHWNHRRQPIFMPRR